MRQTYVLIPTHEIKSLIIGLMILIFWD